MFRFVIMFAFIQGLFGFTMAFAEPSVKIVMSKNDEVCAIVKKNLFETARVTDRLIDNSSPKKLHEVNFLLKKQSVMKVGDREIMNTCDYLESTVVDINNDGKEESVFRKNTCLSGIPSQVLYVQDAMVSEFDLGKAIFKSPYPASAYGINYAKEDGKIVEASINGMFEVSAFRIGRFPGEYYLRLSSTDKFKHPKYAGYHVVTQLRPDNKLSDICYFQIN